MKREELETKLQKLEELKNNTEVAYWQLVGQITLLKSLLQEDLKQNENTDNL